MNIKAIIWDYDGTLVDTRVKNLNVTRKIIKDLTGQDTASFPVLRSQENYDAANRRTPNWRELYRKEFDFPESLIDKAGRMWTPYQLDDDTGVEFYSGIAEIIGGMREYPQGIVSQNSRNNILRNLERYDLLPFITVVIGYEEVDIKKQKPEPDGLLNCIEELTDSNPGCICYIGDHETDVQCAGAARQILQQKNPELDIICIGACYDSGGGISRWKVRPDFTARTVRDIADIIDQIKRA